MSRIAAAFEKARLEGRAAFVAYLTAGDPDAEATVALARAMDRAGADVLELGVPFSDPIADGPVLQRAAERALAGGTTLSGVLEIARRIRKETGLALVLFSYLNPLLRPGIAAAASEAAAAGFDGALVTDLPPEEAGQFQPALRSAGLDTIFLVSPTSPPARMRAAAALSTGFLYVVSRPGTTGARRDLPADLSDTLGRARRAAGDLPIAVGFGIATPEAARQAARLADGVIVGSALVRCGEEAGEDREAAVERLARSLRMACRRGRSRAGSPGSREAPAPENF
ncbi:MAG TPA: tryptophan synthase subunit alpha [Thermoanaerobaculia bacterium]|nr:tryptophan synthase subunit alpha [Thermoanaerobaculia bacterium]